MWRKLEAMRDRLMHGCGTDEPWFYDAEFYGEYQSEAVAAHWRKPLSIIEVNMMAPTQEVRRREGRP
jgi:hypothetical protein